MTYKEFMTQLREYYGDYKNAGTGKMVCAYLIETFEEKDLGWIMQRMIRTVSTQYGHVPDVATIEKIYMEKPEILPTLKQRKLLTRTDDDTQNILDELRKRREEQHATEPHRDEHADAGADRPLESGDVR